MDCRDCRFRRLSVNSPRGLNAAFENKNFVGVVDAVGLAARPIGCAFAVRDDPALTGLAQDPAVGAMPLARFKARQDVKMRAEPGFLHRSVSIA